MLSDLNRELVEKKWFLPDLEKVIEISKKMEVDNYPIEYLLLFYSEISFSPDEDGEVSMGFTLKPERMLKSEGFYYSLFKDIHLKFYKKDESDQDLQIFEEIYGEKIYMGEGIPISEIDPKSLWLKKTTLPEYCKRKIAFHKAIYSHLVDKHNEKKKELSDLIFS